MILEVCIIVFLISSVRSYNLTEDCSLRLGSFDQGFFVNCRTKEQNEHFVNHLRQSVLLPLVVKTALKTDLCSLTSHLSQGFGALTRWRRRRRKRSEDSKAALDLLTTEQLETLLYDLQFEDENNEFVNGSINFQSQQQEQHVTAEVHTHKHFYIVQGMPFFRMKFIESCTELQVDIKIISQKKNPVPFDP